MSSTRFVATPACCPARATGFAYHADAKQFAIDRRRDATLVSMGYRVLRFTWVDVVTRPAYVVETVRRAVALAA